MIFFRFWFRFFFKCVANLFTLTHPHTLRDALALVGIAPLLQSLSTRNITFHPCVPYIGNLRERNREFLNFFLVNLQL